MSARPFGPPDRPASLPPSLGEWGRNRCVALLENDPVGHDALRNILTAWGFRVVSAQTVDELRSSLDVTDDHALDMVLTDFHLDHEDGLDVVASLREVPAWSNTPALLVTGDLDLSTRLRASALGVPVAYKPLSLRRLRCMAQDLIG